uniref:Trinucleotide repeat-containing gene 6C protein n=1 Tax=Astatotilapia calliptera TaxID=8154 RepID=A0AAX7SRQ1_ASTCA
MIFFVCVSIFLVCVFHTELPPQSGQGAQYDNPLWGHLPANRSATSAASSTNLSGWDQLIIDQKDTEAWPSITLSQSQVPPGGCPLDTDSGHLTSSSRSSSTSSSCSTVSMATGANSQTGHFPANHLSSKANSGPSPANHTGTSMLSGQVAASRSWGPGAVSSHCPPQSSMGSETKSDSPGGGGSTRSWGPSSSSSTNFNLNLNPNANPSAWPMLGHDGSGTGGGSSGGANTISPPHSTPNLCNPPGPPPAQTSTCTGANTNSNSSGIGNAWITMMASDAEPHPSPSTNVSFSSEPQNLKTDGPNHTNKQEPPSPIRSLPGWGSAPVGLGSMTQPPPGGSQVNGEDGNSVWGNSGNSKASSSKEAPGWGHEGDGTGNSGGWGEHPEETQGGWDTPSSPAQDSQSISWSRAVSTAAASEGSSDSMEGHPQQKDRSSREKSAPLMPAQDLDPRVLCNSGWGQTPVRQHTSWDMDDTKRKSDVATGSWGSGSTTPVDAQGPSNTNTGPSGPGGWGNPPPGGPSTSIPKNGGQSWGEKPSGWEDSHIKSGSQNWGEQPKASHTWASSGVSNNTAEWGDSEESKKSPTTAWEGEPRGWGMSSQGPGGNGGWGESLPQRPSGPSQGWGGKPQDGPSGNNGGGSMGSWGGSGSVKQGPGRGGNKQESSTTEPTGWEEPSPPSIRRKMEIDDGTSAWGDPGTYNKAVNLWDRNNSGSSQAKVTTGGNNPPSPTSGPLDPTVQHQPGASHSRGPLMAQGWGEISSSHTKSESSWGEPASSPVSVDNGTSAWGKPSGNCGGWGESNPESYGRGNPTMTPASCKPAPKPMQDGWGGGSEDLSLSGGQWDAEEVDMWNSTASQESNSSCNSWSNNTSLWKQDEVWIMNRLIKQLTDMGFPRDPAEEALKSNNMNLDQAMSALLEKKTELDKRGMGIAGHDYNNGLINKPMSCPRPPLLSKDPSADPRLPFMDKVSHSIVNPYLNTLCMCSIKFPADDSRVSKCFLGFLHKMIDMSSFRQVQSGMFGGGGAAQVRAMPQPPPQPPVPPLSSSQPSLRAQVPQFLSPQVQAQLLQFAAKNIGLNPALLTSPINPQHMTLLNQLYQLQLAYQRLQIQQQMLQAQRNVSGPIRQQEQQVARTINNMQQQIQQHQRQLAQALLMKQQQQQPPPSHSGLHPGGAKSSLDSFPGHPQAPGLPDLQTKEPQSSPNTYSPYSLSGLNVNCMEVGSLSMKEPPQPQSRLSQWTHPNSIESLSGNSSPLEPNLGKHGANLGPPGKPTQLDESYSPYSLISSSESPSSPLVPPDSWGQSKGSSDKMANGTNINWPPEFCPGVPWKGLQNIDPETDPNVTPGSVPSGPTINTNIQDVNRYLLRDRSGGKLSEMKSTWSPGPISHSQASLSHELWKVPQGPRSSTTAPSRPPPGLTNTKPSSTWGGSSLGLGQGTTWSTDSSTRTSSWLVLRNLTPQIDGSTLRTLCMQHGPLITFHLNLTQGNAVVRYSSKDEAAKAQKSLHMCVLGNTTILAEFAGEEEVNRFFAQGQSLGGTTSWQATPGTNQTRMGGTGSGASHPIGHSPHWNNNNNGAGSGELLWGGVQQYSSLWGPPSGEEGRVMGSPTPINTLLPGDLLSGESM